MLEKTKKIIAFLWPVAGFCLFLFVLLKTAHAQALGGDWDQYLKGPLKSFGGATTLSGEEVAVNVIRRAITLVKYGVGALALLMGLLYATNLVFARGKEESIAKQKMNFLWIFVGFVILMAADQISNIFNVEKSTSDKLIDFKAGNDQLRDVANYLKWLLGSIIVFFMTISGVRMITAADNEEVITKQKRNLVWSGIGMLVILLAGNIVNAIYVTKEETGETAVASVKTGIAEIGGVIRLILVFLGPIAVIFTIYAGFLYLTALEKDEQATKGKRMIVAGVTAIIIIYAAFALVNTFITGTPSALPAPQ